MTINNKSERNYRGKCLGSPVTSYGGDINLRRVYIFSLQNELEVLVNEWKEDKCIGNIIINHVSHLFTKKSYG